ncbi:hypothetical protein HQQ81_18100 [Microbacteriaceae bacterium VKM Ac-2854]|nr:hypothetical protein [Microbacteriaceae bacterium VKM Ac-2854]
MNDSLTVSGGGSVRVETSAMSLRSDRLQTLLNESAGWNLDVLNARGPTMAADPALDTVLDRLGTWLSDIGSRCGELSGDLDRAAVEYGEAEEQSRLLSAVSGSGSDVVFGLWDRLQDPGTRERVFGWWARRGGEFFAAPGVAAALGAARIGMFLRSLRDPAAREPVVAALMTDGTVIDLIRWVVEHLDDLGRATFPVEWTVATMLAAPGRPPGPEQSAAVASMLIAAAGLVARAPRYRAQAQAIGAAPEPADPPRSFGDLERRLPAGAFEQAQLGVQRIGDEYIVYLRGTEEFELDAEVPFDMRSNIELLAGEDSASVRATFDAMRQAGVPAGAPVTFVGHSQGAMVAARIARSGAFDVHDIVSFGGPILQVDLPAGTRVVSFEHEQDAVPAAGGVPRGAVNEPQVLRVRRELDPSELADLSGGVLPAHGLTNYRATADLADASTDERLTRYREQLLQRYTGPAEAVQYFTVSGEPLLSPAAGAAAGGR